MAVFSSRADQLAIHLRRRILRNEWHEPFPNTREWARQLAVGRNNLCAALNILQKQGLLEVRKRQGIRLKQKAKQKIIDQSNRIVRIPYYGVDYPFLDASFIHWAGPLSTVLQKRGGQLSIEKHSDERLRELCESSLETDSSQKSLLLPLGIPAKYQRMLVTSGCPCIHIGPAAESVPIPYLVCDMLHAIRHATRALIDRGFRKLTFLLSKTHSPGGLEMQNAFLTTCREWTGQNIEASTLLVRLHENEERIALTRFAERISLPHGILIVPPLSAGLVATTLMDRGIQFSNDVEMMVVGAHPDVARIHPPPTLYPFPMESFVKTLAKAIFAFWETGENPTIKKTLPLLSVSSRRKSK